VGAGVGVGVMVLVGVGVSVGVWVRVGEGVRVGVCEAVAVRVGSGVLVGCGGVNTLQAEITRRRKTARQKIYLRMAAFSVGSRIAFLDEGIIGCGQALGLLCRDAGGAAGRRPQPWG